MVSPARRLASACLVALTLLGCSETIARTQLMLVADTDIPDLDTIRFEVRGGEQTQTAETSQLEAGPATLALIPKGSKRGPLTVTARGLRNGESVVERAAEVSFVARQTLVVQLHLLAACVGVSCGDSETCTESGCSPRQLDEDQLSPWTGDAPALPSDTLDGSLDAGLGAEAGAEDAQTDTDALLDSALVPDADAGDDAGTDADASWTDCGTGATRVDLETDIANCGSCGNVCRSTARNTVPTCELGDCGSKCRPYFDDCDENPANGCEQSLVLQNHCGMCDRTCEQGTTCRIGICL